MMDTSTLTMEDIYGVGILDTVPEAASTVRKTNPNDSGIAGVMPKKGEESILFFFKNKNLLGQPLTIWAGLVVLLVALKYVIEK